MIIDQSRRREGPSVSKMWPPENFNQVVISWPESIGDLQDIDRDGGMRVQGRSWIPLLGYQSLPNMAIAPPPRDEFNRQVGHGIRQ